MYNRRRLYVIDILRWADAHRARTGRWPSVKSGPVKESPDDTWRKIGRALEAGVRGLPGGSSLPLLLEEQRGVRHPGHLPPLSVAQILKWADAYHRRTGQWPTARSGRVAEAPEETWCAINLSLKNGRRGLPAKSSLAKLLAEQRNHPNSQQLPPLTYRRILQWADEHKRRTGKWPNVKSGPVKECPGTTWRGIQSALSSGTRGLPGGTTLPRLLAEHRDVRSRGHLPPLSLRQILMWADAHHRQTGRWPTDHSGTVTDSQDETWNGISQSLKAGRRGLSGGSTLVQVLVKHRGKRNHLALPRLTRRQILAWADEHHARTGSWPDRLSGPVRQQPGATWSAISHALEGGQRGLTGRTSLGALLAKHRGAQARPGRPKDATGAKVRGRSPPRTLTIRQILEWADAHHKRIGRWPSQNSGVVRGAPQEDWRLIDHALRVGCRGLPGGSSLVRLLAKRRGARNPKDLPRLTMRQILAWAGRHHQMHKVWPRQGSGPVRGAPGETWAAIDSALRTGSRGLAQGYSLARLLAERKGTRNKKALPKLTIKRILAWADEHKHRTGRWPLYRDGRVANASGESWNAINTALSQGWRGLPGDSSLVRMLAERRGVRNRRDLPRLTITQILAWADEHYQVHGAWPQYLSGPIPGVAGETWSSVNTALQAGSRGLPGGQTLAQLLAMSRKVKRGQSLSVSTK